MRKNNYYNFSALFEYEEDIRFAPADSMDVDNWVFFSCDDDVDAGCFIYVLQQAGKLNRTPWKCISSGSAF